MTLTSTLPFVSALNISEAAIDACDAGEMQPEEMIEHGMKSSLPALEASGYFVEIADLQPQQKGFTLALPERIAPEEAFNIPGLLQQVEEIERDCHHAKDVWTRGTLAMLLLMESGKFGEYVSDEGLLTDAGREFLASDTSALRKALIDRRIEEAKTAKAEPESETVAAKENPAAAAQPETPAAKSADDDDLERWKMKLSASDGPLTAATDVTSERELGIIARLVADDQEIELRARAAHALEIAMRTKASELFPAAIPLLRQLVTSNYSCLLTTVVNVVRKACREPDVSTQAYLFLFEAMSEVDEMRAVALGDFSGTSQMSVDARRIVSEDMQDPAQRRLLDAAMAKAVSHTSPRVQRVVTKLITEMNAAIFTELQGTLFYDKYWIALTSRLDPEGPGRLALKLANSPYLVFHAVSLLRHDRSEVWEATATAFSLIADKVNISPALPLLGELQHRKVMGIDLSERKPASNPYRKALEEAGRNPATRETALALLRTRGASEARSITGHPDSREKTLTVEAPATPPPPPTRKEIDELVQNLGSWDRRPRDKAAASLRALFGMKGKAGVYAAMTLLDKLKDMNKSSKGRVAAVLASAAEKIDISSPEFFDLLVASLRDSAAESGLSIALRRWAHRPGSRERALTALAKGIASEDLFVRSISCVLMGQMLSSTVTHRDAWKILAATAAEPNPLKRAAAAVSMGKAFQAGHPATEAEIDLLGRLLIDRDRNVRNQAEWAIQMRSAYRRRS